MSKKVVEEVNKVVWLLKDILAEKIEIKNLIQKHNDRYYFDLFKFHERMRALEDHLGVKYEEEIIIRDKKYKKCQKNS